MRPLLVFLLAATASAQPAPRADSADAPHALGTVTVTAARVPVAAHEAAARITVVDREALDASAARSVADALAARTHAFVRRYGPSGLATVALRGAASGQTLLLLDGQRLADPQLGQVDLALLPAALLESVEVLHGAASGLYGSDALGGVVHLRSSASGHDPGHVTAEAGPWDGRLLSGMGRTSTGPLSATVAAEWRSATDDYAFADRTLLGEPRVRREGWDHRRASAFAALAAEGCAGRAAASVWVANAERGLGGTAARGERQWDRLLRVALSASAPVRWGRLEASTSVHTSTLRYANPYPAPADRPDALDETGRTRTASADLRATRGHRADRTLTVALALGEGRATHPSLAAGAADRHAALSAAGAVRVGAVTLFPSLRADLYAPDGADRRAAVSPHLGLNARLDPAGRLRAKASAGRAFRMPTLNDRFWLPGGNPGLRPEHGWSADAGLSVAGRAHRAEATVFARQARDQIVWAPTDAGFWAPSNVSRTRAVGLEGSASADRALRVGRRTSLASAGVAGTLLDARDLDTGQPLRYVPRWTARAWSALAVGALRLDLSARADGARFTTASASLALPATLVADAQLRVTRQVGPGHLTLGIIAENLLDARYEVVRSYVMPPRHARLTLTLTPGPGRPR
jgi:outer membrane cobalamin receptor